MRQLLFIIISVYTALTGCRFKGSQEDAIFKRRPPSYDLTALVATQDTIRFHLDSNTYNKLEHFNYFFDHGEQYLSAFDSYEKTVNIFSFSTHQLEKKIPIMQQLELKGSHKKIGTYVVNFDSIITVFGSTMYLSDSSGKILKKITSGEDYHGTFPVITNSSPPAITGKSILFSTASRTRGTSLKELEKWTSVCEYNFTAATVSEKYFLPPMYTKNYYGRQFIRYSQCHNDRNRLVLSFAADSLLYETDFGGFHASFLAKSNKQLKNISPVEKDSVQKIYPSERAYRERYAYGAVYYDRYRKKYLRVAYSPENPITSKREQRVILFDNDLSIIGESTLPADLNLKYFLCTPQGIYVWINRKNADAIDFLRLDYIASSVAKNTSKKATNESPDYNISQPLIDIDLVQGR